MRFIANALIVVVTVMSATAGAVDAFVEGTHFERVPIPVRPADESTVEVIEVFSYGCVHCKNFDPALEQWLETEREGVTFRRLPAVFGSSWEPLARWYYTAQVLGVHEAVHTPLFRAVHEHRIDIRRADLAARLFETAGGVTEEQFIEASESFQVSYRIQQDHSSIRKFRISGVPTMVVGGLYKVNGEMAGSNDRMLEVVSFLIEKIQKENASESAESAE